MLLKNHLLYLPKNSPFALLKGLQNLQSSVEDSKRFQEQVSQLAVNLEQMNKVYGNMLTAMNPNK